MAKYNATVSVIIPTSNRNELLNSVLPHYLEQPYVQEIIIVDDASRIPIVKTVKPLQERSKIPIRMVRFPHSVHQPVARNRGVELAQGEWIFMGEDDAYPEPEHFHKLLEAAISRGWQLAAGRRIEIRSGQNENEAIAWANKQKPGWFTPLLLEGYFDRPGSEPTEVPFVHANAMIHRDVFKIAQYDAALANRISYREETDFFLTLHENGVQIGIVPDTIVFHLRSFVKKGGGIYQIGLIKKEILVWRNEWIYERKHKRFFTSQFGPLGHPVIRFPIFLIRRYFAALWRRLLWKWENRFR